MLDGEGDEEYEIDWKIPQMRIIFEGQTIIENFFQIILSFLSKKQNRIYSNYKRKFEYLVAMIKSRNL